MNDTPQPLFEFTKNLIDDLRSESLTAHEALSAMNQYAYLREFLDAANEEVSGSLLTGGDAFTRSLLSVLTKALAQLEELPNFHAILPDVPGVEKEIRDSAALRAFAVDRMKKDAKEKTGQLSQKRRAFVHALVQKYSASDRTNEAAIESAIDRAVVSPKNMPFAKQLSEALSIPEPGVPVSDDFVRAATRVVSKETAVAAYLIKQPSLPRPDVFVDVIINAPETELPETTFLRAEKLSVIANMLGESSPTDKGRVQFFSANAAKGVAGGLQKGVDGILSLVGEPVREIILREKINDTLRTMLTSAQSLGDRLGGSFVTSALFTHITQNLTGQLAQKPAPGQFRSVFDDVVSSVFRGPIITRGPFRVPIQQAVQERILDYIELSRANAAAPKGASFLPQHLPLWDMFRVTETKKPPSSASSFSRTSGPLAFLRAPVLWFGNSVGLLLGNTASTFIDRITSFAFTGPKIRAQLSASRRAAALPIPIGEDMPLLVAAVVIAVLLLFFILPTPFNLSQISHSAKVSSILAALQNIKEVTNEALAEVTSFRCEWNGPTPPAGTITTCPVHAAISQGPFSSGSHATLNAWDFAAEQGTPVVSAHDAYAVSYVNSYAPNQYQNASYGNNVVLVATDPSDNKQYCTNYAHLLDVAPIVVASAGQPIMLSAGTVIGYVDTTGYTYGNNGRSTGTHLHWGYKGADPRKDFLPPGCP